MSHSRTKAAGWAVNETLTSAQMNDIDIKTANSVDKSGGDTITGALSITSGATVSWASGTGWTVQSGATGTVAGIVTVTGAGALIRTTSSGRIELADNDYPTLNGSHTGRSQTRKYGAAALHRGASGGSISVNNETMNIAASGYQQVELMTHHGATLGSVEVRFTPNTGHAGLPAQNFRIEVYRRSNPVGALPAVVSLLSTTTSTYSPVSLADYNNGLTKQVTLTCNQNNTIDRSVYSYELWLYGEGGANALAIDVREVLIHFTSIADMRFA